MTNKWMWWLLPLLAVVVWWLGYAGDANGVWPWRHEMLLLTGLLGACRKLRVLLHLSVVVGFQLRARRRAACSEPVSTKTLCDICVRKALLTGLVYGLNKLFWRVLWAGSANGHATTALLVQFVLQIG
jgi:hypothetical protein